MADEERKKLSIINEILRLESSTKEALRSSRDEIESLQVVANLKKDEVVELEKELSGLECKVKKKRTLPSLRPKRLRRLTISSAGEVDATMFRRNTISEMAEKDDSASIAGIPCDEGGGDDGASCTFTVGTFDNVSLWNSFQSEGDASTFNGEGSVLSNDTSCIGSYGVAIEMLNEKKNLLYQKQAELKKYRQKHHRTSTILQQMHQQLSVIQREQKICCVGYNSTIESLAKTKTELIARIRWRENRILEEGQKLLDLKQKFAAAKSAEIDSSQCQNQSPTAVFDDEEYEEFMNLITECSDVLTGFSSSVFELIKSTITLPDHSSISYSIGDPSDTFSVENKTNQNQHVIKDQNEEKKSTDNQQQLDELNVSVQQYGAKIQMIQNELAAVDAAHRELSLIHI